MRSLFDGQHRPTLIRSRPLNLKASSATKMLVFKNALNDPMALARTGLCALPVQDSAHFEEAILHFTRLNDEGIDRVITLHVLQGLKSVAKSG